MNTQKDSASSEQVLEKAAQRAEKATKRARVCEQQGDFDKAAAYYDQAAKVWQRASGEVAQETREFCLSLANYWAEHANEARSQVETREKAKGRPQRQRPVSRLRDPTFGAQGSLRTIRQAPPSPGIRESRGVDLLKKLQPEGRPIVPKRSPAIKGGEPGMDDKTSFRDPKKIDRLRLLNNQEDNDD